MINEVTQGDCLDALRQMPSKSIPLAVVDPPYGIKITRNQSLGRYASDKSWDDNVPPDEYFEELFRVSERQIIWGGNYFKLPPCKGFLIWDKMHAEGFSYASCEFAWSSFDRPARTFYMRPGGAPGERIHPTQKPIQLYDWIFKNYAEPGWTILDTHVGSGSSRIAADRAGLHFIGFEMDSKHWKDQDKRWRNYKAQLQLF